MTLFQFRIGGRYRTRAGRMARCVCVDRVSDTPMVLNTSNVLLVEGLNGELCICYAPDGRNNLGRAEYDIVEDMAPSDEPQIGDLVYVSDQLPIRREHHARLLVGRADGWFATRPVDGGGNVIDPTGSPTLWRYAIKRDAPTYRTPTLPADWGRWGEFSDSEDFRQPYRGRLCGYRPGNVKPWVTQADEYKFARIQE